MSDQFLLSENSTLIISLLALLSLDPSLITHHPSRVH